MLRQHDHGARPLIADGIGQSDHGTIVDRGMREQHVLDLARQELQSVHIDVVAQPAFDEEEALCVDAAEISGVEPSVVVESVAAAFPIAGHYVPALDQDLAHAGAVRLIDPDAHARSRAAGGGDLCRVIVVALVDAATGFGQAIVSMKPGIGQQV